MWQVIGISNKTNRKRVLSTHENLKWAKASFAYYSEDPDLDLRGVRISGPGYDIFGKPVNRESDQ